MTQTLWIHQATFTFTDKEPSVQVEALWVAHPGWGYLQRKDLWIKVQDDPAHLESRGFVRLPENGETPCIECPHCGMRIFSIPGYFISKHRGICGGGEEDYYAMEEQLISVQRLKWYEAKLERERLRLEKELAEAEKRERFDRIREDQLQKQRQKDRKLRLKEEARKTLRER